jgi:hypothetical protein
MTVLRVSQLVSESASRQSPRLRAGQLVAESLARVAPELRAGQLVAESLVYVLASQPPRGRRRFASFFDTLTEPDPVW